MFWLLLFFSLFSSPCSGLDNGLALTPPMGWMTWQRFRCNIDCKNDPMNCIGERLIRSTADQMVSLGFLEAGYEYVIVDDCWLSHDRDENGRLQPNPEQFPSGMKALGDYIHSLGLKFGLYEDYGNFTCAGYPGVLGSLELDAQTFADWGVDYVKLDGCYADLEDMDTGYPEFGGYLNATGRPMVYSCSWPAYQVFNNMTPDYRSIAHHCNLWRNYGDIQDSWEDVVDIVDWYGDNQDVFADYGGPGNWNDPDMLIIGDFSLSVGQARAQMAVWSVLAAPLIMSNDLRSIRQEYVDILLNTHAIKINQDPLGHQGRRVYNENKISIFVKTILPSLGNDFAAAVAIFNKDDSGTPRKVNFRPIDIGLKCQNGYQVVEVFDQLDLGHVALNQNIELAVDPVGVQFIKLVPSAESKFWYEVDLDRSGMGIIVEEPVNKMML